MDKRVLRNGMGQPYHYETKLKVRGDTFLISMIVIGGVCGLIGGAITLATASSSGQAFLGGMILAMGISNALNFIIRIEEKKVRVYDEPKKSALQQLLDDE